MHCFGLSTILFCPWLEFNSSARELNGETEFENKTQMVGKNGQVDAHPVHLETEVLQRY